MSRVVKGELDVAEFCNRYEQHFNFDWTNRSSEPDIEAFQYLFDVVIYFTPYPQEKRSAYPSYKTAAEVLDATNIVLARVVA